MLYYFCGAINMSIEVSGLTKVYGQRAVVDGISFAVRPGEIVGFLGPNGAGKSTTMKILTGYLPATAGTAMVCGRPAGDLDVRRKMGYLPEHNPLYLDMFVHEFLRYAGKVSGLRGEDLDKKVKEVIARCGLAPEQNKIIESLSKGYRQRVGLAQAMLPDPEVLILDEPTTGLDPNQIVEIRELIRSASSDKTVIFSTHIMQEVEAICDRVLVINDGRIVADDKLERLLAQQAGSVSLIVEFDREVELSLLEAIEGISTVTTIGRATYRLQSLQKDLRPAVFTFSAANNLSLIGLKQEEASLESVFRALTQNQPIA